MATTAIGKELRKLRIEQDERLLDMAARIGKSSAFLSAVETGKKSPPSGFEELVIKTYRLVGEAAEVMRNAAYRSRAAFTLEAGSDLERDMAGLMARRMNSRMNSLSPDEIERILAILRRGEKEQ